ncbi:MAG: pilin [Candidatus Saccharimonadales bacterium]
MNRIKTTIITLALAIGLVPLALPAVADAACTGTPAACAQQGADAGTTGARNEGSLTTIIGNITNILLFVVGAVGVIMLIIGGLRYVLSGGDSGQTKAAKDTILYAVVGIIVALLAYAIVNFVLGQFTSTP